MGWLPLLERLINYWRPTAWLLRRVKEIHHWKRGFPPAGRTQQMLRIKRKMEEKEGFFATPPLVRPMGWSRGGGESGKVVTCGSVYPQSWDSLLNSPIHSHLIIIYLIIGGLPLLEQVILCRGWRDEGMDEVSSHFLPTRPWGLGRF